MSDFVTEKPSRRLTYLLLLIVVLAGLVLRTWNVNFDRGIGSHPDERSTSCFYAPTIHLPKSWEEFRDPRQSPMNPLWSVDRQARRGFTYGHLPLYMGLATGEVLYRLAPLAEKLGLAENAVALMARANRACDAIAVAGRLTIALLDTLTILLLYALGARIFGRGAGLLTAAFYAFAAQAVQLSHFFAMDPASTTFTVLTVLGGVLMVQKRTLSAAALTGVAAGLAIASKFSALPVLAVPVTAAIAIFWQVAQTRVLESDASLDAGRDQFRALMSIPIALVLAGVTFFITSPYAVLDWESFIQATLIEQGRMVRGVADFPFTRQYRNTIPYLYFIEQQVKWGLGWPLGLLTLAGTLVAVIGLLWTLVRMAVTVIARLFGRDIWRAVSQRDLALLVVWSWIVPYFGLTGAFLAKFNRYMSPILPFVLLFAAGLIWRIWNAEWGVRGVDRGAGSADVDAETEEIQEIDDAGLGDESNAQSLIVPVSSASEHPVTPTPQHPNTTTPDRWRHTIAATLAAIGIIGGVLWSLAYVNGVYNREHTWISASRWVYENVPEGSVILWELWDDPLPKSLPDEPGMDMGSTGLRNIDWSPYEEDTVDKYAVMKAKLREADYVAYSSKRIYDSVDELPTRYPMTNRYYQGIFDGSLGYELVLEQTSPPELFGFAFDDRHADESWSLYDHPQVLIFRKVRDLSDAEYDVIFDNAWTEAEHWYRGADSPLSPFLNALGLGSDPAGESEGLINRLIALATGEDASVQPEVEERLSLNLDQPLTELPIVDNYRWNRVASENPGLAIAVWWGVLTLLGWFVWPLLFGVLRPLRDRGYLLARGFGWLLPAWALWLLASQGWLSNTVVNSWAVALAMGLIGAFAAWRQRRELYAFLRENWGLLLTGELIFVAAYLLFILIRMANPDLWQPWFGGEKFMEFAFLNGILRSPTFPPVDPHFAGGFINYYYFGIYLVAYLIKLTGIYAEVAFNLAIPTLFALTVINAFSVAHSAHNGRGTDTWRKGAGAALIAPLFVTLIGNLDGIAQVARNLARQGTSTYQSAFGGLETGVRATTELVDVLIADQTMPTYDFWGPSRVIPYTINEFPFWSFLFADLHPHMIGIPFAVLFLGLVLTLIKDAGILERSEWPRDVALLLLFSLMLGTLASVNLWELPTYILLGVAALLVSQFRTQKGIRWGFTFAVSALYIAGAYIAYLPFFRHYANVGASGIGFVKTPDELSYWVLVWGFLLFIVASWLFYTVARPARPAISAAGALIRPRGAERALSLAWRRFDELPRLAYLHRKLVHHSTLSYQLAIWGLPLTLLLAVGALIWGRTVLALCMPLLTLAFLLLWRRGRAADPGAQFATLLMAIGLAILAGTQVVYLKDFLQGGDWRRMNTLFKFFIQVWVLWGVAAGVAAPRLWRELFARHRLAWVWRSAFLLLLIASLAYPLFGTPARLEQRLFGWQPPFGTLDGLAYMEEGVYTWPDDAHRIELSHDREAIRWLLDNVRGNAVIVESSEIDYYRAGGTRIASHTGLSGLRGMHESEQRYGEDVGRRAELHNEFWATPDIEQTQQLIDELSINLIYVGQLERQLHPAGVAKLAQMVNEGYLTPIFTNDRVTIYVVAGTLEENDGGVWTPS